ncbi:endoplasmic reticulum mannosyl-oligosaccharide 1,2-alpha-mannosidase [Condylostylus longicornis]|uniref:endoplasmic reticulum mannosyl-oligosaccharide 1,2-alpha-mannosidase n=1 Tax=Condylostylus longicornis TaxID=2530218 RepID=UPI00244DEC48|nr:endoplasmic reticulum mannosyl-oligosaccharide 1,2-alpha-mannosidase [Condylostylus longicornis]
MIDEKSHVALNIGIVGSHTQRKSFRRIWNQLPRCQKNLILLAVLASCIILIALFLPSEPIITDTASNKEPNHINIQPLKDDTFGHSLQDGSQNQFPKPVEDEETAHGTESKPIIKENGENRNKVYDSGVLNSLDAPDLSNNEEIKNVQEIAVEKTDFTKARSNRHAITIDLSKIRSTAAKDFRGPINDREKAVVEAFQHSWRGYKEYAWGHDNLKPVSMSTFDWFGLGLTIVDSLDTLYIMDLQEEFDEAKAWVDRYLHFDINRDVNLFEVTIRVLGGLLSAYHLSGEKMFLNKSVDLGNRLLPCFDSPSGIPYSDVNLATRTAHSPKWSPDSSTSEVTTLQLEFRDLSRSTGNSIFEQVANRVNEIVHSLEKQNGLVPIFIDANTGTFRNFATISLGARGDSYYEYLLKQWLQTGKKENDYLIQDYANAISGVLSQLVRKTPREGHTFVGELLNGKDFKPKMDHLTCYLPGTLLLGYKNGMPDSHLQLAKDLLETCYQTYMKQPTHLAPEISYFSLTNNEGDSDIQVKSNDAHNLLRPEFIESLYYFYALTGNRTYQDMGWNIFEAFEKYTKVKSGYTSIGNVKSIFNTRPRDMMESFWLSETLKYFYLLFNDDPHEIDLEKFVFNSEAHLLPIRNN